MLFVLALIRLISIRVVKVGGSSVMAYTTDKVDTPFLCMNVMIQV